ncbi:MAG: carboxypeptidase regulatory-like domain-containing protein [Labilithrix sp.]|nr:carboxypeptidase regulatory-like domain-containing protein [Labilithrix sp.]MCW5812846.1 carboxypeptidase regulatory-like domain-containing protein [Labilithrix sp.]
MAFSTSRLHRRALTLVSVCAVLYACSSDKTSGPSAPTGPALRGRVEDTSGQPVAGVKVDVGGKTAMSDASGQYTVQGATGELVVRFSKTGFADGLERITIGARNATQLDAVLLPAPAPVAISADTGGEVEGARGVKVVVPPNALVDKSGAPVTGSVDVVLTPLDPSNPSEVRAAPGDFLAQSAGQPAMLESLGMIDITIRRGEEKLQVAAGKELDIRIPAPAGAANPDPTIDLWSFDEVKGVWVAEGTAQYDAATRTYVAKATHLSFWNADKVYLATCACGTVTEKGGGPLEGARVVANGVTYFGTSEATTGEDGKFCIAVRKDSGVNVAAYHKSGGGQAREIQSGSADTDVPPRADDARCVDIGTWEVEKDVFIGSDGSRKTCAEAQNLFGGTCFEQLGRQMGGCYDPSGACTIRYSGGSYEISYANGAKMVSTGTGQDMVSSNGTVCATIEAASMNGSNYQSRYRLPTGEVYTFTFDQSGGYTMTCPNGQSTTITPEQQQALAACSSNEEGAQGGGGGECTVEGLPSYDAGAGGIGTPCENDSTCSAGGNICCDFSDNKVCYPKSVCDQIKQQEQEQ